MSAVTAVVDSDPIALLERAAAAGEDVYQAAIGIGLERREAMDDGKFDIGDLAVLVRKRYGKNRIGDFAKAINCDVERVKEYRTVCAFWQRSVRADIPGSEALNYSHFKTAKRLKTKGIDAALAFLQAASANAWTVEKTRIEANKIVGKPTPPARLLDAEAVIGSRDATGHISFYVAPGVDLLTLDKLTPGLPVRLLVMEVKE